VSPQLYRHVSEAADATIEPWYRLISVTSKFVSVGASERERERERKVRDMEHFSLLRKTNAFNRQ
jgi:hypothetical protein